jgi:S1-C subfamily serine protease
VQVTQIPSSSPLAGLGIESRDTILSVNGARVTSKADLMRYFQKNGDQASFSLDIVSPTGGRRSVTYHVP